MKRWMSIVLFTIAACSGDTEPTVEKVRLRLARRADGRIAIEVLSAPSQLVAVQAELLLDAPSSFTFEDPKAPAALPLDTVRLATRGSNRAILFAGDKRGVQIPRAGELASILVSGEAATASLTLGTVVASGPGGQRFEVDPGPALSIR
jgi:hypothetical protein